MRCPDIARSAHAADDAAVCHQLLELFAGMVAALIRVMQQRVRLAVRAHPAHAAINPQKVSIALHPGPAQPRVAKMVSENKSNTEPDRIRTPAVDLQHLRYAVAAADHGSFRRAADALLLRQSTLSRCIRQLEHSIGMMIFERSSGGVQAASAGRDFLRTARSILEQMDSLVKSTHHAGRGEAGRLSVENRMGGHFWAIHGLSLATG
jgi:hypothetical protein